MREAYKDLDEDADIIWKRWSTVTEEHNGKQISKIRLVDNLQGDSGRTVKDCVDQLVKEAGPFAKQVFVALWQYRQYELATKTISDMESPASAPETMVIPGPSQPTSDMETQAPAHETMATPGPS